MECWSVGVLDGLWRNTPLLQHSTTPFLLHHSAQQPSWPYCCEPRRSFVFLMASQVTEPSRLPRFPPVAPRSAEEAPLALSLLKSPAAWTDPLRPWGATDRP